MSIILDTCALLLWSLDPDKLSDSALVAIEQMEKAKNGITSSMAIWEIAIKVKNKKLDLGVPLDTYVTKLKQSDVIQIIPVDEDILIKSVNLQWSHRDPVDRIIVAIASYNGFPIITKDSAIKTFYAKTIW